MLVYGLTSAVELLSGQANDVSRMRLNVLDDKFSNGFAAYADLAHFLSTIVDIIVNFHTCFVNLGLCVSMQYTKASLPPKLCSRHSVA